MSDHPCLAGSRRLGDLRREAIACWTTCSTTSRACATSRSGGRRPTPSAPIASHCRRAPTALREVHAQFMRDHPALSSGNAHPGFMGWVQGGGTPVGMLAEMLAAGMNANLGGRDHMAIEVERQIDRLDAPSCSAFPKPPSGIFVTGTSMANFIGVLIARTRALGATVRRGLASPAAAG